MRMNGPLSWKIPAGFVLVLATVLLGSGRPAFSQTPEPTTPTPEVEQLKKRLQQLEQTVGELKGQINAIEAKKTSSTPIVEATYSEPAADAAPAAAAKQQDSNKGESTFTIYGFAMLDAGYQL